MSNLREGQKVTAVFCPEGSNGPNGWTAKEGQSAELISVPGPMGLYLAVRVDYGDGRPQIFPVHMAEYVEVDNRDVSKAHMDEVCGTDSDPLWNHLEW